MVATTAGPSTSSASSAPVPVTTVVPGTSTDDGLVGPQFSDALGVRVDGAPGVRTRGDTRKLLDAGLWVHIAWEPDPQDPSVFTVQPDDIPILEAYANAVTTFYRAATTDLIVRVEDFAPYMIDGGAQFVQSLDAARQGGFVNSLGSGIYLRPYVLADRRSADSAVILDCTVSDEAFVLASEPERSPGEPVLRGQLAVLVLVNGVWMVETFSEEPAACL